MESINLSDTGYMQRNIGLFIGMVQFFKDGLTLYLSKSLVRNIGFDGTGTHCNKSLDNEMSYNNRYVLTNDIVEKDINRQHISLYLKNQNKKRSIMSKIKGVFT